MVAQAKEDLSWPSRVRARYRLRKAERKAQRDREALSIQHWLEKKAPTPNERLRVALESIDSFSIEAGSISAEQISPDTVRQESLYKKAIEDYGSRTIIPPSRSELEVLRLFDLEDIEWDVPSMLDAHRNHCTALDDTRSVLVDTVSPPLYTEVSTYMYDPRHEMGPRQRDWHRRERNQPRRTTRKGRK